MAPLLQSYLKEMQKHKVSHLVRVCDASYDATRVGKEGIEVKDWPFVDGDAPPDAIITQWLELVTRMSESNGVRHRLIPSCF
jgi:protein tyrosine phosphatase type 4A